MLDPCFYTSNTVLYISLFLNMNNIYTQNLESPINSQEQDGAPSTVILDGSAVRVIVGHI